MSISLLDPATQRIRSAAGKFVEHFAPRRVKRQGGFAWIGAFAKGVGDENIAAGDLLRLSSFSGRDRFLGGIGAPARHRRRRSSDGQRKKANDDQEIRQ
jgi:hypothetical protein